MSVAEVADALERAPPLGAAVDEPEGARFVAISDTALNRIIGELRLGSGATPSSLLQHERTKSNDYVSEG